MDVSAVSITDTLIRTAAGKYTLSGPNVNVGIAALSSRREGAFVASGDASIGVLKTRAAAVLR
jgi:hypothetical protein